jgi:hypothetical protein
MKVHRVMVVPYLGPSGRFWLVMNGHTTVKVYQSQAAAEAAAEALRAQLTARNAA